MLRIIILISLVVSVLGGPTGKIVGGKDTTIEEYPHQVSVQYYGVHDCGGSIIGTQWILTAGHCTDGRTADSLTVRVATSDFNYNGIVHGVKTVITHPDYLDNEEVTDYDYALLELEKPIELGSKAKIIALPEQGEPVETGIEVTVTGWGSLYSEGPPPEVLQVVQIKVISNQECLKTYPLLTEQMLCAGIPEGGKDTCQGDSGGPLIAGGKLLGVVSYGYGCAEPGIPGIYALVASQRNWVKSISGI